MEEQRVRGQGLVGRRGDVVVGIIEPLQKE